MSRIVQYFLLFFVLIVFSPLSFSDDELLELSDMDAPQAVPQQDKYIALETELARYQIAAQKPWEPLYPNKKYRMGKKYQSIPALRERLILTGDLSADTPHKSSTQFDHTLQNAIKRFQARHGLNEDGIMGAATVAELNIPPEERMKSIEASMQRWISLSKQLGERYIIVNIPDCRLFLVDQGRQVLSMKVIVGKPDWQTPEIASQISRIILNPYWHVPNTIAAKDIVPKLKRDPYYLDDMHIRVFIRDTKEEVDKADIDWENVQNEDSAYHFRQEPGDDNALGLVKFEFPNSHDVYLHDTPTKQLFNESNRALSHGCVRLERAFDLFNYLLKNEPDWSEDRIQTILSSHHTKAIQIQSFPIFITYMTVWVDENGIVNYRDDIYKRDNPT